MPLLQEQWNHQKWGLSWKYTEQIKSVKPTYGIGIIIASSHTIIFTTSTCMHVQWASNKTANIEETQYVLLRTIVIIQKMKRKSTSATDIKDPLVPLHNTRHTPFKVSYNITSI